LQASTHRRRTGPEHERRRVAAPTPLCYVFVLRLCATYLAFPTIPLHECGRIAVLRVLPGVEQLLHPAGPTVVRQQREAQLRVGVALVPLQQVAQVAEAQAQVGVTLEELGGGEPRLVQPCVAGMDLLNAVWLDFT